MTKKIVKLEMAGICKSFHGLQANKNISLEINRGEILGLLGENGAGKTTLMKILYGLYQPNSGEIRINGQPVVFRSPKDAIRAGIGMVHQHFMLVQNHTVAENVALGYDESPFFFPGKKIEKQLEEFHLKYGLKINPAAKVWQLSAGEQQRVEIVKALLQGADLLILDEPTSVLTPGEAKELFAVLKTMAGEGHSVIIISHKLEEILDVCGRVVVLRRGERVGEAETLSVSKRDLARMMVGRDIVFSFERRPAEKGDFVLEVEGLSVPGDRGVTAVRDVSFEIHKGEIFGIAGVSGNGQRELVEAITGLRRVESGCIRISGKDITNRSAKVAHAGGISHVPEERIRFGTVPNLFIYENAVLKHHHFKPFSDVFFLDYKHIKQHARDILAGYKVAASSINVPMKNLSGGNIQKLILGREIAGNPALLVASHPTYGLDVGATEYIRKQLLDRRDRSGAVLLVSEDLEEIFELSDRIAVIFNGTFMGIVDRDKADLEDIGLMMAGTSPVTSPVKGESRPWV
jgi:simple sugar transport system ATP-binding protein